MVLAGGGERDPGRAERGVCVGARRAVPLQMRNKARQDPLLVSPSP